MTLEKNSCFYIRCFESLTHWNCKNSPKYRTSLHFWNIWHIFPFLLKAYIKIQGRQFLSIRNVTIVSEIIVVTLSFCVQFWLITITCHRYTQKSDAPCLAEFLDKLLWNQAFFMTVIFAKHRKHRWPVWPVGLLERRGETSPGGKTQGRRGAPEAGEREERQRGQGDGAEGQKGQGEGLSNRPTKVGSSWRNYTPVGCCTY